ncbi:helix-turn-helix domain-containing protein [Thiohalocapsa marina]|uniref:helix-turn-helix domain-containing protein n=1 Tax=Thiohalocapsa marina TaxID=424902 RepID=UPI0036D91BF5
MASNAARDFGEFIRTTREARRAEDRRYSLRQVALRMGVQPAYLSQIERGQASVPSEERVCQLAEELDVDVDVLLAMAGKVSKDLQEIIRARPEMFAKLIRALREAPDERVEQIAREIRDGDW